MTDEELRPAHPNAPALERPRVLHLLNSLARGGIETWLTHVFDAASKDSPVQHELVLMQEEIGPYEEKVRRAGVVIHTVPMRSPAAWLIDLYRFLKRNGPFAVFHAHVETIVAGPALAVAAAAGVPVRLIHNHAARSMGADFQKFRHKVREAVGNTIAGAASTRRIAISEMAMEHLAGRGWRQKNDCTILLYGFDYGQFRDAESRATALRRALDIPAGAKVVGHVGRFHLVKNHAFLVDAFARYASCDPAAVLVLVGRGPLQPQCEAQVARLGLEKRVRFAGGTEDIAAFMRMFDIFVFPSFSEGLGIVVLEAQAAGTPVLMPENMPREVIVIEEAVTELPLSRGEQAWADCMAEILARPAPDASAWLARVEQSRFGMRRCTGELNAIYAEELARANARQPRLRPMDAGSSLTR